MMKSIYPVSVFMLCFGMTMASVYTAGHGDIGLGEGNGLELHVHLHEGALINGASLDDDEEFAPGAVTIAVPHASATERPAPAAWDFIGNPAGETFWVLPESHSVAEAQGAPFLGIGAEAVNTGVFVNDDITLSLTGVSGPGHFCLYQVELGSPVVYMASHDGITDADAAVIALSTGHGHFNFGFSSAGFYDVTLQISAVEATTGALVSDEATFGFQVIPEPGTFGLLGMGGVGFLRRRRH